MGISGSTDKKTTPKVIKRQDRKGQNPQDRGSVDDEGVTISAPQWVEEALLKLSPKLEGATFIVDGKETQLSNPLTLRELSAIARNESANVSGKINTDLYEGVDPATIVALRDLAKHLVITGKVQVEQYGGYPPQVNPSFKLDPSQKAYVCDLPGLQFQDPSNTGRHVLIAKEGELVKGSLDDEIYQGTVGEKKPTKEQASADPSRFVSTKFNGKDVYLDTKAYQSFVAKDFILAATSLNEQAKSNGDEINFKFLKYGAGFFAEGLSKDTLPQIDYNLALGVEAGLDALLALPPEQRSQIKRIELPFFESKDPEVKKVLDRIKQRCEQNGIEFSAAKEDALKPTSKYVTATTNCSDPHAPTGNEMGYQSVDAAIATNVKGNLNNFNAALNSKMQQRYTNIPSLNLKGPQAVESQPTASSVKTGPVPATQAAVNPAPIPAAKPPAPPGATPSVAAYTPGAIKAAAPNPSSPASLQSLLPKAVARKVATSDLKDGRLISPADAENVKRYFNDYPGVKKLSKNDSNLKFSVIKDDNGRLYALYRGKEKALGKGHFGQVKLAQDLETGEWVALKTQKVKWDANLGNEMGKIQREQYYLNKMGQLRGAQSREYFDKTTGEYYIKSTTAVKLHTGEEVAKISERMLNQVKTLEEGEGSEEAEQKIAETMLFASTAALTTTQNLGEIHDNNLIHRDLHTGNILIDEKGNATIIDFGCAKRIDPNTKTAQDWAVGRTDVYSPELQAASQNRRQHVYTTKEDMWALGNCLKAYQFKPLLENYGKQMGIPPQKQQNAIQLINRLNDPDPQKRPSAKELAPVLQEIQNYIRLAQGIDLRKASKEEVQEYQELASKLGPSNGYSSVKVFDKNGKILKSGEAINALNITGSPAISPIAPPTAAKPPTTIQPAVIAAKAPTTAKPPTPIQPAVTTAPTPQPAAKPPAKAPMPPALPTVAKPAPLAAPVPQPVTAKPTTPTVTAKAPTPPAPPTVAKPPTTVAAKAPQPVAARPQPAVITKAPTSPAPQPVAAKTYAQPMQTKAPSVNVQTTNAPRSKAPTKPQSKSFFAQLINNVQSFFGISSKPELTRDIQQPNQPVTGGVLSKGAITKSSTGSSIESTIAEAALQRTRTFTSGFAQERSAQQTLAGPIIDISKLYESLNSPEAMDKYGLNKGPVLSALPPPDAGNLDQKPTLILEMRASHNGALSKIYIQNNDEGGLKFYSSKNADNQVIQNACKISVDHAAKGTNFQVKIPGNSQRENSVIQYLGDAIKPLPPERAATITVNGKKFVEPPAPTPLTTPALAKAGRNL